MFRSRIKIGFTNNVKGRMSKLRGGSPSALKLILLLPGTLLDEAGYHELFSAYRLHGEWFRYGLKLRLFVWANQFGVSQINPEIEANLEPEPGPLPVVESKSLSNEPEIVIPNADEKKAIDAFISVRDSDKFSWRKATKIAYSGKFGEGPNKKLRETLDKFDIDYQDYIDQKEKAQSLQTAS